MDTSAKDISFDNNNYCNFCTEFTISYSRYENYSKDKLNKLFYKIKNNKTNSNYDCIIGISGGVDSSWTLIKAIENDLKPLAVHVDNGWNSELAQNNISNLIKGLNVDLFTLVIDWEEYRNLMKSFFEANVVDIELLYDNAIFAVNYQQANKHKLNYILAGTNHATEGMMMPSNWNWYKYDKRNIFDINNRFVKTKIKTFPSFSTINYLKYHFINRIQWVHFLDYFEYNKLEAINYLKKNFAFKAYPYKHYESIFTRFYQGYILPKKFKIDKRRVHLSNLIVSNQISRKEAISYLESNPYHQNDLESDKEYFLKKMDWTEKDLNNYLSEPEVKHDYYKSENQLWNNLSKLYQYILNVKRF